jgi:hypothetical protein
MDAIGSDSLLSAARDVEAVVCFRSLPVVGYALLTRQLGLFPKLVIGLGYFALCVGLRTWSLPAIAWLCLAYGYFAAAGSAMPWMARALRERRLTRGGAFAACAGLFLAFPCLFVPSPARATAVVVGWDIMLSSFSYCIEVAKTDEQPPLRDCLFFLLVNPALVYARRGRRIGSPALRLDGIWRAAAGLATLLVVVAFVGPACAAVEERNQEISLLRSPFGSVVAYGVLRFFLEYWRQSGLASVQIGLMRQLGQEIPERFNWPILATDPLDFWRRWNTYVSGWLLRYVFWPFTDRYRGSGRSWRLPAAQSAGILVTFICAGLLHDLCIYAATFDTAARSLRAFSAVGSIVVLWLAVVWCWRRLAVALSIRGPLVGGLRVASRVSFWVVAVSCVAWGWP